MRTAFLIWLCNVISGTIGCMVLSSVLEFLIGKVTLYDEYPRGRTFVECWRLGLPAVLSLSAIRGWGSPRVKRSDAILPFAVCVAITGAGVFAAIGLWLASRLQLLPTADSEVLPIHRAWFQSGLLYGTMISAIAGIVGVMFWYRNDGIGRAEQSNRVE